ncbi:MAG: hypothetical protein HIU93_00450 [Acidobacteria bacterium]|nr:hypothetical protein [Acidobacteriota bacterium]MBW4044232.1 hypothetical protein [Acidobacteriota bacterium]
MLAVAFAAILLLQPSDLPHQNAPLPDAHQLMQRALANEKKMAAEQERYECRVTDETVQTDSKGNVKHTDSRTMEQFYVNGVEIERTLSRNGKDLSPSELKKEDERVMKQTVKYSDQAKATKETDHQNQQIEDAMEAMQLTNGRRQMQDGRSVLLYDIVPNPKFDAKNMNQRFAQAMQGTMSVDEKTGELIDFNIRSVRDIKIAGGLVGNLHKGFWMHIHDHPQPDGVWLTDLTEGSGDARAALFFHPYFRFKETTGDCHLYTTDATQVGQAKLAK